MKTTLEKTLAKATDRYLTQTSKFGGCFFFMYQPKVPAKVKERYGK